MLTDVDGIRRDFGTETAARIDHLILQQARQLDLPAGSMKPKSLAAAEFAANGGACLSCIGRLKDAVNILHRKAGAVNSERAGCRLFPAVASGNYKAFKIWETAFGEAGTLNQDAVSKALDHLTINEAPNGTAEIILGQLKEIKAQTIRKRRFLERRTVAQTKK